MSETPAQGALEWWRALSRGQRRTAIALLILIDANLGLLYGLGLLDQFDSISGGKIPNDMVWLLQAIESISGGFFLVKILFDDVAASWSRSIGIALSDGSTVSIQSLYQQADMAAFVAKEKAGSNYIIFDTMLDGQVNRKFDVERSLKAALEYGYINIAFQPQVDLKTGRTTGFESLARWRDPVLGAVSPGEFVTIAEESSLIQVLDREIISKALMSAGTWLAPDQKVSINASARSLNTYEFAHFVLNEVKRSGLNYEQVEVEFTESALIENWD